MPDGRGIMLFPNGDRYQGEWKDGRRHGQGIYVSSDGDKYECATTITLTHRRQLHLPILDDNYKTSSRLKS